MNFNLKAAYPQRNLQTEPGMHVFIIYPCSKNIYQEMEMKEMEGVNQISSESFSVFFSVTSVCPGIPSAHMQRKQPKHNARRCKINDARNSGQS